MITVATAKLFADNGMSIVIWDKNLENLEKTREELQSHLQKGFCLIQKCVDITSPRQVLVFSCDYSLGAGCS